MRAFRIVALMITLTATNVVVALSNVWVGLLVGISNTGFIAVGIRMLRSGSA